jgi:RNA-directed DNA polymerase
MSDDPRLRWGFAHEQTPRTATFHVKNRFKKRQRARRLTQPVSLVPTIGLIASTNNLIRTFYEMRTRAGQAPGPDGITYSDLGRREAADLMRELSRTVLEGQYRPAPTRELSIPKLKGGHRTLRLGNILDRVLSAALNKAMVPYWENIFLPCSMGFWPCRGVWQLLAELELLMLSQDRWVLALDDIKDAFPSVIIADVMADHTRYITEPSLLSLIKVVLQGSDRKRHRGIDQGSPYSPTALNVRLHHALDLGVDQDHHQDHHQGHHPLRYWRYADNLACLCRSVSEGHQALDHLGRLLEPAGFTLKGEDGVINLQQGEQAQLLGFSLSARNDQLQFGLGQDSWTKLKQNLVKAHSTPNPSQTASMVVQGWIEANGPAFANWRTKYLNRILQTASELGFRETGSRDDLADRCEKAWRCWKTFQMKVGQEASRAGTLSGGG